jgi:hypothetical protein
MSDRILVWFSCGVTSALAAKLAILLYGQSHEVVIVSCDTRINEHPDNYRFSQECEQWFKQPIVYIQNEQFATVDQVFETTRYMAGINGARCTTELKKRPRQAFERDNDIHVFGFTLEEKSRIANFELRNPEMKCLWILRDQKLTKQDCLTLLQLGGGIMAPMMYSLGFKNNNCLGCVKATSPKYWNLTRRYFPEVFQSRAQQSRALGVRLTRYQGQRIFLDELPPDTTEDVEENISCGPECGST